VVIAKLRYRRQARSRELCYLLLLNEESPVSLRSFCVEVALSSGEDRWFKFGSSTEDVES
jgi:hypothetical protein